MSDLKPLHNKLLLKHMIQGIAETSPMPPSLPLTSNSSMLIASIQIVVRNRNCSRNITVAASFATALQPHQICFPVIFCIVARPQPQFKTMDLIMQYALCMSQPWDSLATFAWLPQMLDSSMASSLEMVKQYFKCKFKMKGTS